MACLGFGIGLVGIFGFFVEPLSREFEVGTAVINIGPIALVLVPAFAAPLVGRLVDRMSIRGMILAGVTLAMLSLMAISVAPSLRLLACGFLMFALGLTLYGPVVINGMLVKTYPGSEARALGIAAMGISVASVLLPPLMGVLMADLGWRLALGGLAFGLLFLLWLLVLAGIPATAGVIAPEAHRGADSGLYRSLPFWLIGLCVAMGLTVSLVLSICYPPHFLNTGYSAAEAGLFLAVAGACGLGGKLGVAWLGDAGRAYARWVAAALLLIEALGIGLLLVADGPGTTALAVGLAGVGAGGMMPMHPYLNSRYFDAARIGEVNGAQAPLFLPFALVGAPLSGYAFDQLGNYQLVLQTLSGVLIISACLAMALPPSQERVAG